MVVELVVLVIFWLNAFTPSPSLGGNLIPRQIITGLIINYTKHFRLQFGKYAQVHESYDNTMQERTTRAIALRPTGNTQGASLFMSLTTGRRLNCPGFTPLPLPQDTINTVHYLLRRNPRGLDIQDRDWRPFIKPEDGADDNDNDSTYALSENDNSDNEDDSDGNESDNYNNPNLHPPPDR